MKVNVDVTLPFAGGVTGFGENAAVTPLGNPEAVSAVAALNAFPPKRVIQIVGGYDHHLPITAMCGALVERAKAVLCIGATAQRIADTIADSSLSAAASVYRCGDLATAVRLAKQIAVAGDVVLLSTGFKSYDQFDNFEQRGDAFAKLARNEL